MASYRRVQLFVEREKHLQWQQAVLNHLHTLNYSFVLKVLESDHRFMIRLVTSLQEKYSTDEIDRLCENIEQNSIKKSRAMAILLTGEDVEFVLQKMNFVKVIFDSLMADADKLGPRENDFSRVFELLSERKKIYLQECIEIKTQQMASFLAKMETDSVDSLDLLQ